MLPMDDPRTAAASHGGAGVQRAVLIAIPALAYLLIGCGSTHPALPEWQPLPEPSAADVESVTLLVGDAGLATDQNSPLLLQLRGEAERWAAVLPDSSVTVLFLGDNIYPEGIRNRDDPGYPQDSATLYSQIAVVAGPDARARRARGVFVAGNHDWGNMKGQAGLDRLRNEEMHLDSSRIAGINVSLLPRAGTGGPAILDVGDHLRLIIIDTVWWLFGVPETDQVGMTARLEAALREAPDRRVVVAAHHPWQTAGPHGGLVPFWEAIGIRFLLNRSGAALNDLSSPAYQVLHDRLDQIFSRAGRPLAFAAGHDHSLQVIGSLHDGDPEWSLVSGSASKLTDVGTSGTHQFRQSSPGYMRLVVLRSGEVELFVVATKNDYLRCDGGEAERAACLREGLAGFETVYSLRLK